MTESQEAEIDVIIARIRTQSGWYNGDRYVKPIIAKLIADRDEARAAKIKFENEAIEIRKDKDAYIKALAEHENRQSPCQNTSQL